MGVIFVLSDWLYESRKKTYVVFVFLQVKGWDAVLLLMP